MRSGFWMLDRLVKWESHASVRPSLLSPADLETLALLRCVCVFKTRRRRREREAETEEWLLRLQGPQVGGWSLGQLVLSFAHRLHFFLSVWRSSARSDWIEHETLEKRNQLSVDTQGGRQVSLHNRPGAYSSRPCLPSCLRWASTCLRLTFPASLPLSLSCSADIPARQPRGNLYLVWTLMKPLKVSVGTNCASS